MLLKKYCHFKKETGIAIFGVGIILILVFVPFWLWMAFLGGFLIFVGCLCFK